MRHRSDGNQEAIIAALRKVGAQVWCIGEPVDLLVSHRQRTFLVECKLPGQRLSGSQLEFIARWQDTVHVVHSPMEALRAILGAEAMK